MGIWLEYYFAVLTRTRHQAKLDIAQVCNDIPDHEEPVVLHVNFQVIAKIGTLGEQHKMGE
jgi:hypothetical protein